ncbi:MAG: hypothetical protein ACYC54_07880 [Sedimentisphaerales bacterium]
MKNNTNKPYMREPGDFEIRILKDGKVVMLAPDEALIEIAKLIEPNHYAIAAKKEAKENVRGKNEQAE